MHFVEAIYEKGVFTPLGKVDLSDQQRVELAYQPVPGKEMLTWLDEMRRERQRAIALHGVLPDSTPDIAAERLAR
jgi:predicted DNA-binding antitoxin AbrB/MazE fold protein